MLARYPGVMEFLASLGSSLQIYFENLSASFPNQQSLEADQLFTFVEASVLPLPYDLTTMHSIQLASNESNTILQGVETLISASHRASRESTIILKSPGGLPNGASGGHVKSSAPDCPVPAAARSPDCNVAYICEADGLVTQVSGALSRAFSAPRDTPGPGALHSLTFGPLQFSLLTLGSSRLVLYRP